jgi:hypothetical protein
MRFFEFTSSNGNTAHVPVDQFLRIETFDDYQAGNGVVQVLFRNADESNYLVQAGSVPYNPGSIPPSVRCFRSKSASEF